MRVTTIKNQTWEMVFVGGKIETETYTPTEFAAFKRSGKYKLLIAKKLLVEVVTTIKTR